MIATMIAIGILLCESSVLHAQNSGHWEFSQVTSGTYQKYSPQIAMDAWGNTHLVWVSKDLNRSGLQLYYQNNATGQFAAPVQVSDTGSVIDSDTSFYNSSVFRLDAKGFAHVAFVANVGNTIQLYYTDNNTSTKEFRSAKVLTDRTSYDMATDSVGTAHLVWLSQQSGKIGVWYWRSDRLDLPTQIAAIPCGSGCKFSEPQIETADSIVVVAVRTSNGVYSVRSATNGSYFDSLQSVSAPFSTTNNDLRMRMALDRSGNMYVVAPYNNYLYYVNCIFGEYDARYLTTTSLESSVLDFDIATNSTDRIAITWTTLRSGKGSVPKVGFVELTGANDGTWVQHPAVYDLSTLLPSTIPSTNYARRVFLYNDRVSIATLSSINTDSAQIQVGLMKRTALKPQISYLHPDAAAPGMNVVVETIAPAREEGSYGKDGLCSDSIKLVLLNTSDTSRVVIGPSVVSWNGRLLSTMMFVKPNAPPGAVPVAVRVGNRMSNSDTFFVVTPQHLGDSSGRLIGGGVLGSGGSFGLRSRRGVMVVDSLTLTKGTFTIDTSDTDPYTPGNQGFLPVTILSQGTFRIDLDAELSVSAHHDSTQQVFSTAGPGGGGGGAGGQIYAGGAGYTGGGAPGRISSNELPTGTSQGSGGERSGWMIGGPSLNDAHGGATFTDGSGGGGTGHPFGASGSYGQIDRYNPVVRSTGSYGAGTAGSNSSITGYSSGGGGGGYGTVGQSGDLQNTRLEYNAGNAVGCRQIVPLAGGSGGGGGGYLTQGFAGGGGGGGAISLIGFGNMVINGRLSADGANGLSASMVSNNSGGGGGSGGGILLAAQGNLIMGGYISAVGGKGGKPSSDGMGRFGGNGGTGRIRIDGKYASVPANRIVPAPQYNGPSTGISTMFPAAEGTHVSGSGIPGNTMRILVRSASGNWLGNPHNVIVGQDSTWEVILSADEAKNEPLYIVAMQRVQNPTREKWSSEPDWVMSSAGANILGRARATITADSVVFACTRIHTCDSVSIPITNNGAFSDLLINKVQILSPSAPFSIAQQQVRIAAGTSRSLTIYFCPSDTGSFHATLRIFSNSVPNAVFDIPVHACGISGLLKSPEEPSIALGELCTNTYRDTTLHINNIGKAELTVESIEPSDSDALHIQLTPGILPVRIAPGSSTGIPARLWLKRFDGTGAQLIVRTNSIDSLHTISVSGIDIAPHAEFPVALSFGNIDITKDTCAEQVVVLRNKSTLAGLPISVSSLPLNSRFTILNPPVPGFIISPNDSLVLHVRFCPHTIGTYQDTLPIILGATSHCETDTVVTLNGSATQSPKAALIVFSPVNHRLTFPPTLIGQVSASQQIVIKNLGTAPGVVYQPDLRSANAGEFVLTLPFGAPSYIIVPGDSLVATVSVQPSSIGSKAGTVIINATDNTWSDTVLLSGKGISAGAQFSMSGLDFGATRVGKQSTEQEITIFNAGNVPVRIDSVGNSDSQQFRLIGSNVSFPYTLAPQIDTVRLQYTFTAQQEGMQNSSLVLYSTPTQVSPVTAQLYGNGVLEHIAANTGQVVFGCQSMGTSTDSVSVVRLVNNGSYPLRISDISVAEGAQWFSIMNPVLPDTLLPSQSRLYTVRFTANGTYGQVTGKIRVESSAPEQLEITLGGTICASGGDERTITLRMPDMQANLGDGIFLPVLARLDKPLTGELPYTVTVTYNYDLLAPRTDWNYPVLNGTISAAATMEETSPGRMVIQGTIAAGAQGDTLIKLPMRVLLGKSFRTDLNIVDAQFSVAGIRVVPIQGSLQVYGCGQDTNGVQLGGAGKYSLSQIVPNPVTDDAIIRYAIALPGRVRLTIYNSMGVRTAILLDQQQAQGSYEFHINASTLPAGIYTYELTSGAFRATRKLIIQ